MIASTSDPILLSPPSPSPLSPTLSATQALLYQASCRQALACRRHRRPRSSPTSRPLTSTIHLTARFVTARFVLQHLRQPSLVLAEAYRILAPGGRVAFVETDDMIGARRAIRARNSAQFGRAIL